MRWARLQDRARDPRGPHPLCPSPPCRIAGLTRSRGTEADEPAADAASGGARQHTDEQPCPPGRAARATAVAAKLSTRNLREARSPPAGTGPRPRSRSHERDRPAAAEEGRAQGRAPTGSPDREHRHQHGHERPGCRRSRARRRCRLSCSWVLPAGCGNRRVPATAEIPEARAAGMAGAQNRLITQATDTATGRDSGQRSAGCSAWVAARWRSPPASSAAAPSVARERGRLPRAPPRREGSGGQVPFKLADGPGARPANRVRRRAPGRRTMEASMKPARRRVNEHAAGRIGSAITVSAIRESVARMDTASDARAWPRRRPRSARAR